MCALQWQRGPSRCHCGARRWVRQPALLCPNLPLHRTHPHRTGSAPWMRKSEWEVGKDFARFLSPAASLV